MLQLRYSQLQIEIVRNLSLPRTDSNESSHNYGCNRFKSILCVDVCKNTCSFRTIQTRMNAGSVTIDSILGLLSCFLHYCALQRISASGFGEMLASKKVSHVRIIHTHTRSSVQRLCNASFSLSEMN